MITNTNTNFLELFNTAVAELPKPTKAPLSVRYAHVQKHAASIAKVLLEGKTPTSVARCVETALNKDLEEGAKPVKMTGYILVTLLIKAGALPESFIRRRGPRKVNANATDAAQN